MVTGRLRPPPPPPLWRRAKLTLSETTIIQHRYKLMLLLNVIVTGGTQSRMIAVRGTQVHF